MKWGSRLRIRFWQIVVLIEIPTEEVVNPVVLRVGGVVVVSVLPAVALCPLAVGEVERITDVDRRAVVALADRRIVVLRIVQVDKRDLGSRGVDLDDLCLYGSRNLVLIDP